MCMRVNACVNVCMRVRVYCICVVQREGAHDSTFYPVHMYTQHTQKAVEVKSQSQQNVKIKLPFF
jgi:hypothetical protein